MTMYKAGDKFEIEIAEVLKYGNACLYRIKGFKSLVFDEYDLNKLTRAVSYNDAYQAGVADGAKSKRSWDDAIREGTYQQGLNDAWDAARTVISKFSVGDNAKAFGTGEKSTLGTDIVCKYDPETVIKKIQEYKIQVYKEILTVGDEVESVISGSNGVVVDCHVPNLDGEDKYTVVFANEIADCSRQILVKTGKHYNTFMEYLREARNG